MHTSLLRKAGVAMPALLVTIILALVSTAHADDDNSVSILYYESIHLIDAPSTGKGISAPASADQPAPIIFDAYGRRFELQTDKINAVTGTGYMQLRGRLAGLPNSWFSLLSDGDELSGIIADDDDTYIVESRHRVAELMIEAPAENAPSSVIFRLADTLIPRGLLACGVQDEIRSTDGSSEGFIDGQSAFTKLGAELQAATGNASVAGTPFLLAGVVADKSFVNRHAGETENDIAVIFNTVQAIYSNEVGLEVEVFNVFSVTPDIDDPFSATSVAPDLLDELGVWRNANQANLGHTHLLTKRRLVNEKGDNLAGISFLGQPGFSGVCNRGTGASLSRDIPGLTALIVTHELGHNLGAPHDGDPDDACALAPATGFIMSPSISQTTMEKFTDCSLAQMNKVIAAANCLTKSAQTLPVSTNNDGGGGGGGSLGWLSIPGLLFGTFLRYRKKQGNPLLSHIKNAD